MNIKRMFQEIAHIQLMVEYNILRSLTHIPSIIARELSYDLFKRCFYDLC